METQRIIEILDATAKLIDSAAEAEVPKTVKENGKSKEASMKKTWNTRSKSQNK